MEVESDPKILSFPNDLLLHLFKYCVNEVQDYDNVGNVCKKFSSIIKMPNMYTKITVSSKTSVLKALPIFETYRLSIRKIEIKFLDAKEVNMLLEKIKTLQNLISFKIKSVTLDFTSLGHITTIIKQCKELRSIKIKEGRDKLDKRNWNEVLQTISSLKLVEFSFYEDYPQTWNINQFLKYNSETLRTLKISIVDESTIAAVAKCTKLKKLRLFSVKFHSYPSLEKELFTLNNLTSISLSFHSANVKEMGNFFARPSSVNLEVIKLSIDFHFPYRKILIPITNNCPNLRKLILESDIINPSNIVSARSVLQLLEKCKRLTYVWIQVMTAAEVLEMYDIINEINYPRLLFFKTRICTSRGLFTSGDTVPYQIV